MASSSVPKTKGVFPRASERRVILERSNASYAASLVAGKQSQPRDRRSVCFRCFKPGHFARECRSAIVQNRSLLYMMVLSDSFYDLIIVVLLSKVDCERTLLCDRISVQVSKLVAESYS